MTVLHAENLFPKAQRRGRLFGVREHEVPDTGVVNFVRFRDRVRETRGR